MRSSRSIVALAIVVFASTASAAARAQQDVQGFAVERLYRSAPGSGWFVMDALDIREQLRVAASMTFGYARRPLQLEEAEHHLAVVSDQAFMDLGFALEYAAVRLYLDMTAPLLIKGDSGAIGGFLFTAADIDPAHDPDTLSDPRIGVDVRLIGDVGDPVRFGAGAQLFIPNGKRSDYDTDDTFRAQGRLLLAGDLDRFTYATHLGVHIRPLSDPTTPGSPQGSEILFGAAGGIARSLDGNAALVVGPEVYGASATRALFSGGATAFEGLFVARIEERGEMGPQVRVKAGVGGGIHQSFGTPEWRIVFAIEVFDQLGTSYRR